MTALHQHLGEIVQVLSRRRRVGRVELIKEEETHQKGEQRLGKQKVEIHPLEKWKLGNPLGKTKIPKVESGNSATGKAKTFSGFEISAFCFVFGFVDHGGQNGHEFVGFFFQRLSVGSGNATIFPEQFQPQL